MSHVGKEPILIPDGVAIDLSPGIIAVKGKLGELTQIFDKDIVVYKQVITPLIAPGDTIFFTKRWYGRSTTFTIDKDELNFKPKAGQNNRSCEHLGNEEFDKEIHQKYLTHIDINNLKGLRVELIYKWKVGETLIMDRTHIHCSSTKIVNKKLGLTTFTKK